MDRIKLWIQRYIYNMIWYILYEPILYRYCWSIRISMHGLRSEVDHLSCSYLFTFRKQRLCSIKIEHICLWIALKIQFQSMEPKLRLQVGFILQTNWLNSTYSSMLTDVLDIFDNVVTISGHVSVRDEPWTSFQKSVICDCNGRATCISYTQEVVKI